MSQDQDWYDILKEAAEKRSVDLSFIDRELLKSHGTEIASWAGQNLNNANSLTREELSIWQFIERSKVQLRRDEKADARLNTPLYEEDLHDIVSSLQAQTRSIQARSQILRSQSRLAAAYNDAYSSASSRDTLFEKSLKRREEQETQQIFFMNEDNGANLRDKTRLNQERLEKCLRSVDTTVKEKLRADDRILDSLETLTSSRSLQGFAGQLDSQAKTDVLQRAIVLSLKTRLDRIYLAELVKDVSTEDNGTLDDLEQTRRDLQSLYTEIEAVAGMLVQQELGLSLAMIEERVTLLADETVAQDALKVTDNLANLSKSTHQLAASYRLLQACRVVFGEIRQLWLQVQTQTHTTTWFEQGSNAARVHSAPVTLLRHFGVDHEGTVSSTEHTKKLRELCTEDSADDRLTMSHLMADTRVSTHQIHSQRQRIFEHSRDGLSDGLVHNRELDERIAVAKVKLETTLEGSETSVDARRRFVNAYLRV